MRAAAERRPITVGIVSEDFVTARGLRTVCRGDRMTVAFEAPPAGAADRDWRGYGVEAILIDAAGCIPRNRLVLFQMLVERAGSTPVLGVVPHGAVGLSALKALELGLVGLVHLAGASGQLRQTVERALDGAEVVQIPRYQRERSPLIGPAYEGTKLPAAGDINILELLVAGLRDAEIGSRVGFSSSTVKHHIESIMHDYRLAT